MLESTEIDRIGTKVVPQEPVFASRADCMPRLLVIDDDRAVFRVVEKAFEGTTTEVSTANTARDGMDQIRRGGIDVVLLDVIMPDLSGLEAVTQIHALDAQLPVVFITARTTSEVAIEATKRGGYDFVVKPIDVTSLREIVDRALEIRRAAAAQSSDVGAFGESGETFLGRSRPMQEVFKAIGRVAGQDVTVLILGESGTGKELVARSIYQHGRRADKRFLAVNCAAIPEALLESELFGHEKGSFTSAESRRIGKFEQCHGGTLFLDEVGDMSPLVQSKVLRVLQDQQFERVGGTESIKTDVRVVAATNRDLWQLVQDGKFREDLYFRLNGYTIKLPPLRERGEDLFLLLEHSLRRSRRELGKDVHGFSPEAMEMLLRYRWPGNVRELDAVIRRAVLDSTGPVVLPEFLPEPLHQFERPAGTLTAEVHAPVSPSDLEPLVDRALRDGSTSLHGDAVECMERYVLSRVLQHTAGNQSRAAKLLGITRGSLRGKMRTLGINLGTTVCVDSDGDDGATDDADPAG